MTRQDFKDTVGTMQTINDDGYSYERAGIEKLIDVIFDEIGSCKDCELGKEIIMDNENVNFPYNCISCGYHESYVGFDDYCNYFQRKK